MSTTVPLKFAGQANVSGVKRNIQAKEPGVTIKRTVCPSLPPGWVRQITYPPKNSDYNRKNKISYISPLGKVCRFEDFGSCQRAINLDVFTFQLKAGLREYFGRRR